MRIVEIIFWYENGWHTVSSVSSVLLPPFVVELITAVVAVVDVDDVDDDDVVVDVDEVVVVVTYS